MLKSYIYVMMSNRLW